jgi:hypothetical protein
MVKSLVCGCEGERLNCHQKRGSELDESVTVTAQSHSTLEGTQICTDLNFFAFPAATPHLHSSQSIEQLKSQVSDLSTEAILLKTELPKQTSECNSLSS